MYSCSIRPWCSNLVRFLLWPSPPILLLAVLQVPCADFLCDSCFLIASYTASWQSVVLVMVVWISWQPTTMPFEVGHRIYYSLGPELTTSPWFLCILYFFFGGVGRLDTVLYIVWYCCFKMWIPNGNSGWSRLIARLLPCWHSMQLIMNCNWISNSKFADGFMFQVRFNPSRWTTSQLRLIFLDSHSGCVSDNVHVWYF